MMNKFVIKTITPLALAISLSACSMKPIDSVSGDVFLPESYLLEAKRTEGLVNEYENWPSLYMDGELERLVALAVDKDNDGKARNPDIEKAAARYLKAMAYLEEADSKRWPQLSLSVNGQKSSTHASGERNHQTSHQAAGLASFELDLWSKLSNQSNARTQEILASEYNVESIIKSITHQVVSEYWRFRQLDAEAKLMSRQIDTREEQLEIVRNRYKLGIDTSLDVEKTLAKVANLQRVKIELETQKAVSERMLALLTGHPDLKITSTTRMPMPINLPLSGKPSQLLAKRADIMQAESMLKAAGFDISAARAALFPQISLQAQSGAQSSALTSLATAGSSFWTLGFTLDVPLFDRGLRLSQIKQAKAVEKERVADYQQVIQSAFADVNNALVRLDGNNRQKIWIEQELSAAHRALQTASTLYQGGSLGYSEVLDTQQALDDAKRDRYRMHYAELIYQADLIHALGL